METILLAENDDAVRAVTKAILEGQGYVVHEASNGQAAFDLALGRDVDLLITDVIMPGMNGRDLARRLTARWSTVRVLFLSGYTDETVLRYRVLDPGANFLEKPFSAEQLARKVRAALDT
jgi:two-component system, cell cycle sensor histidine kinase and response regulator CckA